MTLSRLALLPALLASTFLFAAGCETCEDATCDDAPASLQEGAWKLRFPAAPTLSSGCERLGLEVEAIDPITVQVATPSDWTFVMDIDGVVIRGERFGDSLVGEGAIDGGSDRPGQPAEAPDGDDDNDACDSGPDDEGDADDKCETTPAPDDPAPNTVALDALVQSPTDMVGELIIHLEQGDTVCEASFGFRGSYTGVDQPDGPVTEPVHEEEEEEARPPSAGDAAGSRDR